MDTIFSYVIAAVAVLSVVVVLLMLVGKKPSGTKTKGDKKSNKTQSQVIRDATHKLARNPNDIDALSTLGQIYYDNRLWDKAFPIYQNLCNITLKNDHPDVGEFHLRTGICAINLDNSQEALKYLNVAYTKNPHNYEVNYYLGQCYFKNKQPDKAVPCLKKALMINPQAEGAYLVLGQCLYSQNHFRESLPYFKKALTEDPNNKEALFDMANAMVEDGHGDKAIKVFMHLRPDPVYGARSCLRAGVFHANQGNREAAVQDFQIGLKHQNTPQETVLELKYRYALCLFESNKFADGLSLLREIRATDANFKDVNALIARYQELSQNTNMQTYLSGSVSDFVTLCRKMVNGFYKNSYIKILDITTGMLYTDFLTYVETSRMEDTEIFRFFRTTGVTGELNVRDFHANLQDKKADKGICITAGSFSDEAHKFAEGRPVDLIEKAQLSKMLKAAT